MSGKSVYQYIFVSGGYHACAMTVDGPLCWGRNDYRQLGNQATTTNCEDPGLVDMD